MVKDSDHPTKGLKRARPWWPKDRPPSEWVCPHGKHWYSVGTDDCQDCEDAWKAHYTGIWPLPKPK